LATRSCCSADGTVAVVRVGSMNGPRFVVTVCAPPGGIAERQRRARARLAEPLDKLV
jgi:hypothetical protein